jgi:hypothetical protein
MPDKTRSTDEPPRAASFGRPICLLALGMLVSAGMGAGCGKERFPRDPSMVPIKGVVTIDGDPTQHVKVIFATAEDVKRLRDRLVSFGKSSGTTNEKGEFAITTTYENDGVLPGDYKVIFEWMPPGVPDDLFEDGVPPASAMKRFPPKLTAIHNKYAAMKPGIMSVKVEEGKPQENLKFELTTGK